jgi:hypothetical protein
MAYFEIFYAWARVYMHSVFGNFVKVALRSLSLLALIGVYFKWITVVELCNCRYLLLGFYSDYVVRFLSQKPNFNFQFP